MPAFTSQRHSFDKVVVYKLDRLSRSQRDTLTLLEEIFNANSVDFVSMSENFDTSTPFGRATIGILAVFAQLEREQIKERMSMGRDARAKSGGWMGSYHIPIGYDYLDGKLQINPYEAMQIRGSLVQPHPDPLRKLYLSICRIKDTGISMDPGISVLSGECWSLKLTLDISTIKEPGIPVIMSQFSLRILLTVPPK